MIIVVMAALVVVGIFCSRVAHTPADQDATSQAEGSGGQSASAPENRLARIRMPERTPNPAHPGGGEPGPERIPPGEPQPTKLSAEEVEKFLQRNHRNATSLRTAFLVTVDTNYLNEAGANFPGDSKVQLSVLLHGAPPEERRKWLDAFKESAPENSLANYLSAREYFNSGQADDGLKELIEATRRPLFQDYTMDSIQALDELGRETGLPPWHSMTTAMAGWASEHMSELALLKNLARDVGDLRKQYQTAGDSQSAENLSQMALALAGRLNGGDESKFAINHLVAISMESSALGQLPPDTAFDFLGGKTPKDRADELRQQKEAIQSLTKGFQSAFFNSTESERTAYAEKARAEGELEAMRWILQLRQAAQPGHE